VPDGQELHSGPGMRRLFDVLAQGSPAPAAPKRFDETSSDGLVRLILEPEGACTIDIDHFGAEAEDGMAYVEATIKSLYNRASTRASSTTTSEETER
jgi:hypothetical protein